MFAPGHGGRKILQLRDAVKQHVEVKVGGVIETRECSLFFDNWLNGQCSCVNQWGGMLPLKDGD